MTANELTGRLKAFPLDTEEWGPLLRQALEDNDVETRDAAVSALETRGGPLAIEILRAHKEERPWLRDYIERVIRDLGR